MQYIYCIFLPERIWSVIVNTTNTFLKVYKFEFGLKLSMKEDNLQEIFEHPVVQELVNKAYKDLDSEVKLPFILKDKILMSPGVWNNFYYSPKTIETIFKKTNWDDVKVRALFLDHIDDRAAEWIGEVMNPRLENGNIVGDLAILDKPTAIKLAYGAKFGISPKVVGEADYNKRMYDGYFENFSVVINPAVKTTFLNSEIKIKNKGGENMPKTKEEILEEESSKVSEETPKKEETPKEEPKTETKVTENVEELAEKIAEILAKKKYPYPKADEELKKKKYPYPEKMEEEIKKLKEEIEELKKKKYPYPEKMSETEQELSAYTDFIKEYLKKHPGATIKEAAKAWGKEHNELEESKSSVTVEDLQTQIGEIVTQKMSEFGVKPIRIAQKFIDPNSEANINASELDLAMFNMIKEGIGV